MWKEFKEFALKGNVLDLAVGVIIGTAFGKIVSSLVSDIIMPIIGLFLNDKAFTDLAFKNIKYGLFIQNVFDFFVIALSIFLFIKLINKLTRKRNQPEEEVAAVETQEDVLKDIRELLRKQNETK